MLAFDSGQHRNPGVPTRPSIRAALRACALLRNLDPDQLRHLESISFMAYADAGQTIWPAGSPAEFTGIVAVGSVAIKRSQGGNSLEVDRLEEGRAFGACCADRRTYPLTAVAASNCWYLKVPVADLHAALAKT